MYRLSSICFSSVTHDPFRVLGLPRTASKADVKSRYRELARSFHPDAEFGDSVKMEQANQAYKALLKEGAYERLHLPVFTSSSASVRESALNFSSAKSTSSSPFSVDHECVDQYVGTQCNVSGSWPSPLSTHSWNAQFLSDDEAERISALDIGTERRTPKGTFIYQNRDDLSWVELSKPLVGSHQTRYNSFAHMANLSQELRRRSTEAERAKNERTAFDRLVHRLSNSGDLPTRNKRFLSAYICLLCVILYLTWKRGVARTRHQRQRTEFYNSIDHDRAELLSSYTQRKDEVETMVVSAAAILLAASAHTGLDKCVQDNEQKSFYSSVRPPPEHFNVHAGF